MLFAEQKSFAVYVRITIIYYKQLSSKSNPYTYSVAYIELSLLRSGKICGAGIPVYTTDTTF